MTDTTTSRIAIIGGGIGGLAAAHRLNELAPETAVTLFEASNRCGGVVATENVDGFCIELGPDSILKTLPWGVGLCTRLGIADELIATDRKQCRTWILRSGRLEPLPKGLAIMAPRGVWSTISSPILSVPGRLRMACEWFVRRRSESSDESFARFACRRFGRETFERLIQPLVSGIYMADPEKLSMQAALPRFVEMEAEHGSLIRAARHSVRSQKSGEAAGRSSSTGGAMFVTPRTGLGRLITAITDRLPADTIQLQSPVRGLSRRVDGGWDIVLSDDSVERFDGVIVATPSDTAARLLNGVCGSLAGELRSIEHSDCVVVTLAYSRDDIDHPMDGHGFVVPQVEKRKMIACTFSSVKYAGRAPAGQVLLRVYLGGATRPDMTQLDDKAIMKVISQELDPLLGIRGKPTLTRIKRLPGVMPQYHVGHLERMDRIDAEVARLPGIELAGNSYRGVGLPHCINSGEKSAEQILEYISQFNRSTSGASVA